MISVILPTRKRVEALSRSLNSLKEMAKDKNGYEVILAFDDDDLDSKRQIESAFSDVKSIVFPHVGYKYIHEYYNRLASEAKGEWLFQWNDDVIMQTHGWDEIINSVDKFCCIGSININNAGAVYQVETLFPIVPRSYFTTLGHMSLHRHTDSWIYYIFNSLGLVIPSGIKLLHDRPDLGGGNNDETYKNREYDVNSLVSEEVMKLKNIDLEKIRSYIYENTR
jgi:glycosyltransferase involved in cell wall biosynthesis